MTSVLDLGLDHRGPRLDLTDLLPEGAAASLEERGRKSVRVGAVAAGDRSENERHTEALSRFSRFIFSVDGLLWPSARRSARSD